MSRDSFKTEFIIRVRRRDPLIVIETGEERRLASLLISACNQMGRPLIAWDVAEGFIELTGSVNAPPGGRDPLTCLDALEQDGSDVIYWLKDFEYWSNPQIRRKLRSVVQRLKYSKQTIVVSCPVADVPLELNDEVVVQRLPLPSADELSQILDRLRPPDVPMTLSPADRARLIQAAQGLTLAQAQRAFGRPITVYGVIDERAIALVLQEKRHIVAQNPALQFIDANEMPNPVAGLELLKEWGIQRQDANTPRARAFGLPAPKGILLLGIQGTGKSLSARMFAHLLKMPLLRLDVGALFDSLVGKSEANLRNALSAAESAAPCVLWIDEIDKGFSPHGERDGGTSMRVFQKTLTWMAEDTGGVFTVATANKISALPPELLRKGRFDEIFFLDLPTLVERKAIFEVHIQKTGRNPRDFDLNLLAREARGRVGAEIEAAVTAGLQVAFYENERKLTTQDILKALKSQVPLSVSHREAIAELRQWLKDGRARPASLPEDDDDGSEPPAAPPIQIIPKGPRGPKGPGKAMSR